MNDNYSIKNQKFPVKHAGGCYKSHPPTSFAHPPLRMKILPTAFPVMQYLSDYSTQAYFLIEI